MFDVRVRSRGPESTGAGEAKKPGRAARVESARTPAHPGELPVVESAGEELLEDPRCYLNRELTWLGFNHRVLHEARDRRTPLLERAKFLSIVGSNVDEFFMKRIGGLKQQVGAGLLDRTVDGRTPQEQIDECVVVVREMEVRNQHALGELLADLAEKGIVILAAGDISKREKKWLREHYIENIYPLITPQATDPAHPFPFISNLSLNLLVSLRYPDDPNVTLARVKVPVGAGIPRFVELSERRAFVPLELVMANNLDLLFPGMIVDCCSLFRVTRNANTEMEEEHAEDLLAMIETELRERRFAPVVRLEVERGMDEVLRGRLASELGLDEQNDVFEVDGMLGLRDLMEIAQLPDVSLHDPPHHPVDHPELTSDRSLFHIIRDHGPLLLHHPYHSFTTSVERLLREASRDPKVRAIKMTLYRTSARSQALRYLIDAARNGKQVAVVVELKARFDEEANIRWASRLEEVGIHVTYGVVGLKTHCKAILVIRQDFDGLRRYAHIGTGNYHAGTARLYSDIGLFSCAPEVGRDLTELFNYLTTGFKPRRRYEKILPSPKVCKVGLLERIEREIEHHSEESPGLIQFKINALEDTDVTRALYRASRAGVRIDLVVRDSCRLRPGVPGLSENVRVIGIVGRFLEHSRVYYFRNGGDEEYFIGSADCMKRNLESRVEALVPIEGELRAEIRHFLDSQLRDRRSAWEMLPDGSTRQLSGGERDADGGCQQEMIEWADARLREVTRLRKRKPRGIERRNVR